MIPDKIKVIGDAFRAELDAAVLTEELNELRVVYLGKKGRITSLLRELKDCPPAEKPALGKHINELRQTVGEAIASKEKTLAEKELAEKLESETVDVTLSGKFPKIGALHPLTLAKNELVNIFIGMGFEVKEGPEIEWTRYNFELLNIPADHPSRDEQDTFYINDDILLRTQTSPVQARTMETAEPPIRIICPGKVYRPDDDATHSPMFQQIEGLTVDKGIDLCDLKGCLDEFAKKFFGEDTKTRFRPSYFPFTEPSVELDVSCFMCRGKGCRLCKGTGWIEVLGAGVVNPVVLENCGLNSKIYSGFAFGIGIERCAMLKYGIPDMKILFENDVRFLRQYK